MSLNWKEINLILEELELEGSRIQKAIQSVFDVLALSLYGKRGALTLLISLSPGACRLHETFAATPKSVKPLRFAQFLNSRIVNGRIEEALQLGDNRIVRMKLRRGDETCFLYIRLWSNAANVIVTDEGGTVLDAMKRLPKRGEISGGSFTPEKDLLSGGSEKTKTYEIRELPGEGSFNRRVDSWYANQGGALSLDSLREQARRHYEGSIGRLKASLEALREKEADFASADRLREYGSLILANLGSIGLESKDLQSRKEGDQWLETENFYSPGSPDEGSPNGNFPKENGIIRIKLSRGKTPVETAEDYFERYRKAKSGLEEVRAEIESEGREIRLMEETLEKLLSETNPLILHKLLRAKGRTALPGKAGAERKAVEKRKAGDRRPGLCFLRKDWIIIVGRDAGENDALLRKYVKGNDLWLHSRDYPGSYVFIKQRAGKTVPLDILLDAGNLAIFYSKGRNSGEGDLFYTPVKYLRRAKNGPRGLVIPTQEKNLHVKVEAERLRELEACRM